MLANEVSIVYKKVCISLQKIAFSAFFPELLFSIVLNFFPRFARFLSKNFRILSENLSNFQKSIFDVKFAGVNSLKLLILCHCIFSMFFVSLVTLQVHYTQINLHSFYISSHVCVGDHTIRLG